MIIGETDRFRSGLHPSIPAESITVVDHDPGRLSTIDLVVPVYNEEVDLGPSVRRLRAFLDDGFPFSCTVTIADNASTDGPGRWPVRWPRNSTASALSGWSRRAGVARSSGPGLPPPLPWWLTWTSICRPTFGRCCRWSHR